MTQITTINENNQGQRLDKFLTEMMANQTRSQIKKLIENGQVLINGKPAKVHQFLKIGDKIEIKEQKSEIKNKKNPLAAASCQLPANIIFDSPDFLVLEKPCGLLVHPTDKGETNTLIDWLKQKYPQIEKVGEQKYRAGIIHRLDRDVSGIMVVAKTQKAFIHLKEQFKKRKVKKEYLALVYGRCEKNEGKINLPIGRNKDGLFVAHPRLGKNKFDKQDKIAKTEYQVIECLKDYTFLSVKILTGRTHQIRAHFSAIGHPVIGDKIYKPRKKFFHFLRRKIKVIDPGRIFLHSTKIGFYNLKNEWVEFNSPLPQTLTNFLDEKRK
jgi:23S rRNA pseudouridine1911/1915/1917 synthase